MLHPFPPTDLFHAMLGGNNAYSTPLEPSPATMAVEDMGILNVNSFEHGVLLPGLDTASIMGMHGDGFARLEHSEEWNAPAEPIFSTWNPSNDQSRLLLQKDVEVSSSDTHSGSACIGGSQKSWFENVNQQEKCPVLLSGGRVKMASSPEKRKGSQVTSVSRLRRSHSKNHVSKPSDSSDNSDANEDDESDKHCLDMRNSPSKNLVSERRRRKKLNERLYSLRALVPKISKLDKASIVSDAISYVEDLQKQVDVMQADIHALESGKGSSLQGPCHDSNNGMTPRNALRKQFTEHRILELEVSQMEEQTYHLRIHCKKGPGVLVQLTSALEALDFDIVNANLTSVNDHVLNTVVVKAGNGEVMTPEELKRRTLDVVPKFGLIF